MGAAQKDSAHARVWWLGVLGSGHMFVSAREHSCTSLCRGALFVTMSFAPPESVLALARVPRGSTRAGIATGVACVHVRGQRTVRPGLIRSNGREHGGREGTCYAPSVWVR